MRRAFSDTATDAPGHLTMWDHLGFVVQRLRERLWIKPLIVSVLSIGALFLANFADRTELGSVVPEISMESTEALLKVIASSMLMMATFAVASMVAAYASASSSATPRSFPLILADDVSQNALSVFMGAFIFSVIALVTMMNGVYGGRASQFILLSLTVVVLAIIILTFIRWIDNISRLGRLGHTVDMVEATAEKAIRKRQSAPRLGGFAVYAPPEGGRPIFGKATGYVQRVDPAALQAHAEESHLNVIVAALPGTFVTPDRPIAWLVREGAGSVSDEDAEATAAAFVIGDGRVFDQDPRFGLVVLSEIGRRALSPAADDPGTAIDVTGTLVRLFVLWSECGKTGEASTVQYDRVAVPELSMANLFDDAFSGIARDGAATVEVVVWLLKAFEALPAVENGPIRNNALRHARLALARAESALTFPEGLAAVREATRFSM